MIGALFSLSEDPRPYGSKKLGGDVYRIRCGDWRIVYQVIDIERRVVIGGIRRRNESTYDGLAALFP